MVGVDVDKIFSSQFLLGSDDLHQDHAVDLVVLGIKVLDFFQFSIFRLR